jgi:hypothetical protein
VREVVTIERVPRAYEELSFETKLVTDRVPVREYVTHEDVEVVAAKSTSGSSCSSLPSGNAR